MPAHGKSAAFESRQADHVIQHVLHSFAVENAPSAVARECWPAKNSQVEAITRALGQRWTRQRTAEQQRLDYENKYVYRSLELGEQRASQLMYRTTHWRHNEDVSAVGTTTLNRVAAGHRIEEQNRVLFEHLLKSRPAVVNNKFLKDRSRKIEEKKKTMSRFRPQAGFPAPPPPRALPIDEVIEDEHSKLRLPPLHSSVPEEDVNDLRERGWNVTTPRDVRDGARRRDNRLRGGNTGAKSASASRTHDANAWCNRDA